MDNPGVRPCQIALAKLPAADFHVFKGLAKENPDRGRPEPQALLDNSIQESQVTDVLKGGASLPENAVHLRAKALLNLRVGRQLIERPRQGCGGRVVTGEQQSRHLVADFLARQLVPGAVRVGFGVRQQGREQIGPGGPGSFVFHDHPPDDSIDHANGSVLAAVVGRGNPARQNERRRKLFRADLRQCRDGCGDGRSLGTEVAGEHRLSDHVEGQVVHFRLNIQGDLFPFRPGQKRLPAVALFERLGPHRRQILGKSLRLQRGLHQPAFAEPLVAFGDEHALAVPLPEDPHRVRKTPERPSLRYQQLPNLIRVQEEVLPVGTHAIRHRVAILPVEAIELLQRILPEVRQD
jgi:hypothetical protein